MCRIPGAKRTAAPLAHHADIDACVATTHEKMNFPAAT